MYICTSNVTWRKSRCWNCLFGAYCLIYNWVSCFFFLKEKRMNPFMVNFNIIFWSLWVELNLPFNMVFLMIDSNQECAACEKSLGSTEYSVFGGNVTCCVMCIFSSSCAVLLNCSTSHTADVINFCQSVYSCIIYQKLFFFIDQKVLLWYYSADSFTWSLWRLEYSFSAYHAEVRHMNFADPLFIQLKHCMLDNLSISKF